MDMLAGTILSFKNRSNLQGQEYPIYTLLDQLDEKIKNRNFENEPEILVEDEDDEKNQGN